jgi:hypothetical protein
MTRSSEVDNGGIGMMCNICENEIHDGELFHYFDNEDYAHVNCMSNQGSDFDVYMATEGECIHVENFWGLSELNQIPVRSLERW